MKNLKNFKQHSVDEAYETDPSRNLKERMWDWGKYEKKIEFLEQLHSEGKMRKLGNETPVRYYAGKYYSHLPGWLQELIQKRYTIGDDGWSNKMTAYLDMM